MKEENYTQKPFRDMGNEVLCVCQKKAGFGVIALCKNLDSWMHPR